MPLHVLNAQYVEPHLCKDSGWNYVTTHMTALAAGMSSALLYLDLFLDRSFLWRLPLDGSDLPHRNSAWFGIIHHPPGVPNSCDHLFNSVQFQEALENCVSLIVFSEALQLHVQTLLQLWDLCHRKGPERRIPYVHFVHHPVNVDLLATFRSPESTWTPRRRLLHIGHHGRDIERFYRLACPGFEKVILTNSLHVPDHVCVGTKDANGDANGNAGNAKVNATRNSMDTVVDLERSRAFHPSPAVLGSGGVNVKMKMKRGSVAYSWGCFHQPCRALPRLSRKQYTSAMNAGIVYIHLVDASAVNTLLECIVMRTPVFINRIPAIEDVLGMTYPLYANSEQEVADVLGSDDLRYRIDQTVDYLSRLDLSRFNIRHIEDIVTETVGRFNHEKNLAPVLEQLDHIAPCRLLHRGGRAFRREFRQVMEPAGKRAQAVRHELYASRLPDCQKNINTRPDDVVIWS